MKLPVRVSSYHQRWGSWSKEGSLAPWRRCPECWQRNQHRSSQLRSGQICLPMSDGLPDNLEVPTFSLPASQEMNEWAYKLILRFVEVNDTVDHWQSYSCLWEIWELWWWFTIIMRRILERSDNSDDGQLYEEESCTVLSDSEWPSAVSLASVCTL